MSTTGSGIGIFGSYFAAYFVGGGLGGRAWLEEVHQGVSFQSLKVLPYFQLLIALKHVISQLCFLATMRPPP